MNPADLYQVWFDNDPETWRTERWFRRDDAFDAMLRDRFGEAAAAARDGAFADWTAPRDALVRVLLLDQIPRNIHRGTPLAFASDARAREVVRSLLPTGIERNLTPIERGFLYLPFEHSENLVDQDVSLALFASIADDPRMPTIMDYAIRHRDVIVRFGRYPHRNAALGRESTPAELEYIAQPGSGF